MKNLIKIAIIVSMLILLSGISKLNASITTFEILKGEKEFYSVNDTVVVKVIIKNTHRICKIEIYNIA